jgi:hypothetical protein
MQLCCNCIMLFWGADCFEAAPRTCALLCYVWLRVAVLLVLALGSVRPHPTMFNNVHAFRAHIDRDSSSNSYRYESHDTNCLYIYSCALREFMLDLRTFNASVSSPKSVTSAAEHPTTRVASPSAFSLHRPASSPRVLLFSIVTCTRTSNQKACEHHVLILRASSCTNAGRSASI